MNQPWKWDDKRTKRFSAYLKDFERQKLGEGMEWGYNKVPMLEHVGIKCKSLLQKNISALK